MPTPNNDETCDLLADALERGERFIHAKFGDGSIEAHCGRQQRGYITADGEGAPSQDPEESAHLASWTWATLRQASLKQTVYMADWMTCSDPQGYEREWADMLAMPNAFKLVAYEALLLHRISNPLRDFYRRVRELKVRKDVLTSPQHSGVSGILYAGARFVTGPRDYDHNRMDEIAYAVAADLIRNPPDVLFLMAGGIAQLAQVHLIEMGFQGTMISLGSALDPLTLGRRTRSGQVDPEIARRAFGL